MSEHPQGALQLLEREYELTIAVSRRRAAEAPEPHYHAEETAASQEISPEAAEGYVQLQNDSSDAEDAVDLEPHARATVGAGCTVGLARIPTKWEYRRLVVGTKQRDGRSKPRVRE